MVKQYVGARYVPKLASPVEWASNTSYEALTIVTFNNASYTSKVPVPSTVGNPANNPQYWALTGNYNAQVEQYRQETETVSNNLTTVSNNLTTEITNRKNADTTLQGNIDAEATTRASADSNLQSRITTVSNNLTTEITNRKNADTTLQGNIDAEASTRASADSNLQSQINQIIAPSGEAPSAAEVQNARIGENGITYDNLGVAIRSQIAYVLDDIKLASKSLRKKDFIKNVINDAGIDSDGKITSLSDRSVFVWDITGCETIYLSGGEVYSFYRVKPTNIGDGTGTLRASVVADAAINVPSGYNYIGVRNYPNSAMYVYDPSSLQYIVKDYERLKSTAIKGSGYNYTPSNIPSTMLNLNNVGDTFENNIIFRVANFTINDGQLNYPTVPFNGIIVSIASANDGKYGAQIAFDENRNSDAVYYRYFIYDIPSTFAWTSLKNGDRYVTTSEALWAALRSDIGGILNIAPGTYNLYPVVKNDILSNDTSFAFLAKDITINGSGAIINFNIPDDVAAAHNVACNNLSIIDIKCNAIINDLTLNCRNTRYCVHFESLDDVSARFKNVVFNNCHFKYTKTAPDLNAFCVGIGASMGQRFSFNNCFFDNNIKQAIFIHGRDYAVGSINVDGCIFVGNSGSLFLSQYTGGTNPIDVVIKNSIANQITLGGQTGGTVNSQYRVYLINSIGEVIVASGITQLYEDAEYNTVN